MANNRVFIKNKKTGEYITLLKYYPETGWYLFANEEFLNHFLESADIEYYQWGDEPFVFEYEIDQETDK